MFQQDLSSAVCYIVSPHFLEYWFHDFVSLTENDRVLYVNEDEVLTEKDIIKSLPASVVAQRTKIIFCSSHRSLVRDCICADSLRMKGYTIAGINHNAVMYSRNKHFMKQLFDAVHIPTPAWVPVNKQDTISSLFSRLSKNEYLFKAIAETSGAGIYYFNAMNDIITDQYYAEVFVEGDEYSVVAVATPCGVVTFPPVWKGMSSRDLNPPYKRLRVCPFPDVEAELASQMHKLTVTLAEVMGISGLLEVEFIITREKQVLVIEINPRVAGTVLMSAMSTKTKIFDLIRLDRASTCIQATSCTVELPYTGVPAFSTVKDMYFSARLTVSDLTYRHVYEKITQIRKPDVQIDAQALNTLVSEILT